MERIIDVAQYIFKEYKKISHGSKLDEMKLHKLLYLSQRECIAITGSAMFPEEFEGWKFGPVSPIVRQLYTEDGMYIDSIRPISLENAYIVKSVILQYGAYASWKLSELSHNEISWRNARQGIGENESGTKKLKLSDIEEDAKKIRPYDPIWDMYYDEFENAEAK